MKFCIQYQTSLNYLPLHFLQNKEYHRDINLFSFLTKRFNENNILSKIVLQYKLRSIEINIFF